MQSAQERSKSQKRGLCNLGRAETLEAATLINSDPSGLPGSPKRSRGPGGTAVSPCQVPAAACPPCGATAAPFFPLLPAVESLPHAAPSSPPPVKRQRELLPPPEVPASVLAALRPPAPPSLWEDTADSADSSWCCGPAHQLSPETPTQGAAVLQHAVVWLSDMLRH